MSTILQNIDMYTSYVDIINMSRKHVDSTGYFRHNSLYGTVSGTVSETVIYYPSARKGM